MTTTEAGREGHAGPGRLVGLEGLRFLAAFAVLVWHYQHFAHMPGAMVAARDAQPLHALLAPFYDFGQLWVQLFWGISGFIFFWKYGAAIGDGLIGGGKFFWLRFSRLYPLHLATLLLVAALQPVHGALTGQAFVYHGNNGSNFLLQLLLATHWGAPVPFSFNGPIWSISAEVFVYALFFMAVRCFGPRVWLIAVATGVCVATMLAGAMSPALACGAFFFAGGGAARAHGAWGGSGPARLVAAAMLGAVALFAWTIAPLQDESDALRYTVLVAMPPLLFLAAQDWRLLERFAQPIQVAGNLTYASYLCHFPLQLVLAVGFAASGIAPPLSSPLFLLAYLGATLVIARLVYEGFERPTEAWLRSLRASPRHAFG